MTILSQAFNFASRRGILLRKKLLLTIQRTSPFCRAVLGLKSPSVLPSCATSIFPISSVLSISARQISSTMAAKTPFERLPTNVVPVNYDVTLKPSLKSFTFEGSETIQVTVVEPTKAISVNCIEIEVKSVQYQADGGSEITGTIEYKKENEIAVFTFPEQLPAGKGSLKLTFTGELNDRMKGFYRSKYTGPDGEDRYGAVTQFEASDARRSFPCWDEPALKATFDITLVVPKNRVALSNMPVISETDDSSDSSLKVVKYDKTPIMSTYLVAYVVGEYDCVEGKDENGVLVRVYTPVGKKEQGQFALDVAVKTLPFYNKYFNIAYPLPKIDLIAIADFSAGAMENWGLVTYRETALLIDPKNSSSTAKQWVALVVGHELAHQWFGNLVTMEWWTHLWLNEGFASWIEYLCVDHCFPEFDIWTQFVNQDLGRALDLDALHTSHPIEVPVGSPDEVDEIFDVISYSKGASVIRMLHNYIGDEDFRKGMNSYLTKYAYKNTFTEDLWGSLREASGKPVDKVMTTWTKQMGFPVIKVTESQDGNNRVLKLSQEKFNADGKTVAGESSEWLVPITISTSDSPNTPVKSVLLEGPSMTVTLENVKPGAWVKLNSGSVGMYRVHYTSEMLDALTPAVRDKTLPPRDRLSLENDLFALARAGLASSVDVLKVTEGFINEDNYTVWSDLSLNLSKIAGMLQYTDGYEAYKVYERALFGPVAKSLGWEQKEGEGVLKSMLRELALVRLGRYGDPDIVAEARRRFADHCDGKAVLPADLRSPVYVTVLVNGDEDIFNKMLKLYDEADMQEEKVRIARLLGSTKDEKLIKRTLDFALSDKVRSQDSTFVIAGVTGSVKGREMGWQFVKDNWTEIHKRYTGGFLLARLCKSMTDGFVTEEKAQEVETFFKENTAPGAERSINQALENVHLNAAWMKNQSASVVTFLKDRPAA
ncbi:puromycin-sensitive aminopeptidase-like isoform X1 [Mya arenaria]|uniref:puromycin-sensitive aminopeptidase-like isoform X1 n=2 Tax=Mya arenaria TaxID=6604 RepID=UPI0022E47FE1|nr:puromycin-sensitive aminopeptidase-like isoform X1 [Mya arenaria]